MQTKRVKQDSYNELVERVGKSFADAIVTHLEKEGKNLEGAGVAFKMPTVGEDESGEDMEDDKGDKPKDEMKAIDFNEKDFIMLSGIKQLSDFIQAMHKTNDDLRKEVKDIGNQLEALKIAIGDTTDANRRMGGYFSELLNRQPASKSDATKYQGGNPAIDNPLQENHKQQDTPVPVFQQMKNNQGVTIPTIPTPAPNGDSTQ